MGLILIVAAVALLIGILIGFLVSKATAGCDRSGNMKNQMASLETRFKDYQTEVANHFDKTAGLSQKLAQDYQEMQAHLVHSVESLVSDSDLRTKLLADMQYTAAKEIEAKAEETPLALDHVEQQITEQEVMPEEQKVKEETEQAAEQPAEQESIVEAMPKDYAPKEPGDIGTLAEQFGAKRK